jgi:purine nucleosidase
MKISRFIILLTLLSMLSLAMPGVTWSGQPPKEPVVFIGGGTIDDQVAALLQFSMKNIDFRGSIITNSDCIYSYAMQNQWKLQTAAQTTKYPITLSDARGWNPFPLEYRRDSIKIYQSDVLKDQPDNPQWPASYPSGEKFLKDQLVRAVAKKKPITLLITDPLTTLVSVLQEDPGLEDGIHRVIWMGGAINVPGNLDPDTVPKELANPKAEWNVYWDPYATDWVFKHTTFTLIVFPLDVTDQASLTEAFMKSLREQSGQYLYSRLALGLYSLVEGQPYFEMWNSMTSVYLDRPDIFEKPVRMKLNVETEGFMQGAVTQGDRGRTAEVVLEIKNKPEFYRYVLKQLQRN